MDDLKGLGGPGAQTRDLVGSKKEPEAVGTDRAAAVAIWAGHDACLGAASPVIGARCVGRPESFAVKRASPRLPRRGGVSPRPRGGARAPCRFAGPTIRPPRTHLGLGSWKPILVSDSGTLGRADGGAL
jgi:hypothetical protein